jgi:HEAT repeat protein
MPILLDIYDHEMDRYVRARAFRAILAIHDFDRVAFLINILEGSTVESQYNAGYELRYFQDPRAIAKLCSILLENQDPNMRYVAAESLASFNDVTAIRALEYARDHDTEEDYEGVSISETAKWALDKISLANPR